MNVNDLENRPGVLKVIKSKPYYTAADVMELLGVGKTKAYDIIKALREQLIAEGKINSMYPTGKVPKKFFDKQFATGKE
ncbi:MAG: ICEBs1 excisionase [Eubacterium sp.]|nr:ICEBs1 excisionase [Eubacterium sp.]